MRMLQSGRLILRDWRITDLEDFHRYARDPQVGPPAGWRPHSSIEESRSVLAGFIRTGDTWAIVHRESGRAIGSFGVHKDDKRTLPKARMIGYSISSDFWGQGLMTESVRMVLDYLFDELALSVVSVYHFPENIRSKRVIEKCGFKYEGTLHMAAMLYNGQVVDHSCWSMTREEFRELYR